MNGEDGFIGDPLQGVGTWDGQQSYPDTCAIRCQEYILESFTGKEFSESALVQEAQEHGFYSPGTGTPTDEVGKLLELHGIPCESDQHANLNELAVALSQGEKVIVGVDSGKLWGEDSPFSATSPDHALVVCGIDTRDPHDFKVLVADPGTGEMKSYEMAKFMDCVSQNHDGTFFMVHTTEATPATAPEMEHFDYGAGHTPTILDMAYNEFVALGDNVEYALGQISHYFHDLIDPTHPDPTPAPDPAHPELHPDTTHIADPTPHADTTHHAVAADTTHHIGVNPATIDQVFTPDQHNYVPQNPEPSSFVLPNATHDPAPTPTTPPDIHVTPQTTDPTLYHDPTPAPVAPSDIHVAPQPSDPTLYHDPAPMDPTTHDPNYHDPTPHQPWVVDLPPVPDHAAPDSYAPHDSYVPDPHVAPSLADPTYTEPDFHEPIHVHVEIDYTITPESHDPSYSDPQYDHTPYHDATTANDYVNDPPHESYDPSLDHTPGHDYHPY